MPPKGISRKETLQNVFGSNWETFVAKMPKWEQDLVSFDVDGLDRMLVLCGLNIPDAANALHKYFGATRKRSREDGLPWDATLYDEICNAEESKPDGPESTIAVLVKKGAPWPGMTGNRLLVRKWNTDFWPKYQASFVEGTKANDLFKVAIMGTPGIGKTVGLCYILHQYLNTKVLRTKRYVVLILPNDGDFYLFDTQEREACVLFIGASKSGMNVLDSFRKDLLVLHDLGRERPMTPNNIPTILATSPKYDKYNEFMKGCDERFYVPPFSDEEMSFAAKHLFSGRNYTVIDPTCNSWEDAAYYFGNVPRDVFFGKGGSLSELTSQLNMLKQREPSTLKSLNSSEATANVNDRLIIYLTDPFRVRFREGFVAEELSKAFTFHQLNEWYKTTKYTTSGFVYETVLHELLSNYPGKLDVNAVRLLKPKEVTAEEQLAALMLLQGLLPAKKWTPIQFCEDTKVQLKTSNYNYPRKPNFPLIDSFVFCRHGSKQSAHLLCFQMTIAAEYPTTVSCIQKFIQEFNKSFMYTVQGISHDATLTVNATDGSCTLSVGGTALPLEVHVVYVTHSVNDHFDYQKLKNDSAGAAPELEKFWGRVHQYHSGPPVVA